MPSLAAGTGNQVAFWASAAVLWMALLLGFATAADAQDCVRSQFLPGPVKTGAFSSDGRWYALALYSPGSKLGLYKTKTGKLIKALPDGMAPIGAIAFSRKGDLMAFDIMTAAGGRNQNGVRVCDLRTWKTYDLKISKDSEIIVSLSFSPDGKLLAAGESEGSVRMWDLHTKRRVLKDVGRRADKVQVAFSPGGKILATASEDGRIVLWDSHSLRLMYDVMYEHIRFSAIAFRADGKMLYLVDRRTSVFALDVAKKTLRRLFKGPAWLDRSMPIAVAPSRNLVANGFFDGVIWLSDLLTGQRLCKLRHLSYPNMVTLAFSPDGKFLLSGSNDDLLGDHAEVRIWKLGHLRKKPRTRRKEAGSEPE